MIASQGTPNERGVADEGERQVRVEHRGVVAHQPGEAAHRGQRA